MCGHCFDMVHATCVNSKHLVNNSKTHVTWTCNNCLLYELPFNKVNLDSSIEQNVSIHDDVIENAFMSRFTDNNNLKLLHLNTQSLLSSFDEFKNLIHTYNFDIVAMSETWLKDNSALLQYVNIQDYQLHYNNRDKIKGGGVGCYVKSNLECKRRVDIEKLDNELEHLWLEVSGRNKRSKILIGIIYRSNKFFTVSQWMDRFEDLISKIKIVNEYPIVLSGDFNINMMDTNNHTTNDFQSALTQFNFEQLIQEPTRTTENSSTLIDLIITDRKSLVTACEVIPCTNISDHDGVYAILNVKLPKYEQHFKYIRSEKTFDQTKFLQDISMIPSHVIYGIDDPNLQLDIFNELFSGCLNEHAPLKKVKINRPPCTLDAER